MIIEFDKKINKKTLHWMIDKIRAKKTEGGSQLLIKKEPAVKYCIKFQYFFLNISKNM